jgi:hypothetical protein
MMATGTSNREIAARLEISYVTARCHVRHLALKLAAHSKLEALVRAQQLDLVGRPTDQRSRPKMAKRKPKNRLTGSTCNRESLAPFTGRGWPLAVIYSRREMRQIPRLAVAGMVAAGFLGGCSPSSAGQPLPGPNGYPPAAEQSLNFQGALNAQVTTAYPSSCGAGTGPGGELFSFCRVLSVAGHLVPHQVRDRLRLAPVQRARHLYRASRARPGARRSGGSHILGLGSADGHGVSGPWLGRKRQRDARLDGLYD